MREKTKGENILLEKVKKVELKKVGIHVGKS